MDPCDGKRVGAACCEKEEDDCSLQPPFIHHKVPHVVEQFLEGSGLEWYRIAIEISDERVDPFFRKLAELDPERRLIIGAGSDIVQLLLGVAKQIRGDSTEVNIIMPPNTSPLELFRFYNGVEAPEFQGREAKHVRVALNGESSIDLEITIRNASQGRYLLEGAAGTIHVPLKHAAIAVVPAEGTVVIFFRTVEDYVNFVTKTATMPDVAKLDSDGWIEDYVEDDPPKTDAKLVLHYAAIILARGLPLGWTLDEASAQFCKDIAATLNEEEKESVRKFVRERFADAHLACSSINEAFALLGLGVDEEILEGAAA